MPLDYNDFAEQIKQKYPEYKDVDNYKLATAMVQKYPEYKNQVVLKKKGDSQSTLDQDNTSSARLSKTTTKPTASLSLKGDGTYTFPGQEGVVFEKKNKQWSRKEKDSYEFKPISEVERVNNLEKRAVSLDKYSFEEAPAPKVEKTTFQAVPKPVTKPPLTQTEKAAQTVFKQDFSALDVNSPEYLKRKSEQEKVNDSISNVDLNLVGMNEEDVVPKLKESIKDYPYLEVDESGIGYDEVLVRNKVTGESKKISLDNWTGQRDNEESKILRGFLDTQMNSKGYTEAYQRVNNLRSQISDATPTDRIALTEKLVDAQAKLTEEKNKRAAYVRGDKYLSAAIYDKNAQENIKTDLASTQLRTEDYKEKVKEYQKFSTDVKDSYAQGKISKEDYYNNYVPKLKAEKEVLFQEQQKLRTDYLQIKSDQQSIDEVAGDTFAIESDRGNVLTGAASAVLKGIESSVRFGLEGLSEEAGGVAEGSLQGVFQQLAPGSVSSMYTNSANRSTFEKIVFGLSESGGAALAGIAAGGPAGSLMGLYASSYTNMKDQMNTSAFKDVPEWQKILMSSVYGATVGTLEELGIGKWFTKSPAGKGLTNWILKKVISELPQNATAEAIDLAIKKSFKTAVANGLVQVTSAGLVEGSTELAQEGADMVYKDVFNKLNEKKFFENPNTWEGVLSRLGESFVLGFAGGAGMQSITQTTQTAKNAITMNQLNNIENLIENPNIKDIYKMNLKDQILSGEITSTQAKAQLQNLDELEATVNKIPSNVKAEDKYQAFQLLNEREEIQKETAGKDPALVSAQTERINAINEELKTISQNAVQKQTTSEVSVQPGAESGREVAQGESQTRSQVATEESQKVEVGGTIRGHQTISGEEAIGDVREQLPNQNNGTVVLEGKDGGQYAVAFSRKGADGKNIFEQGTTTPRPGYISASVKIAENATSEQIQAAQQEAQRNLEVILPTVVGGVINAQAVNDIIAQQAPVSKMETTEPTSPQVEAYRAEEQAELLKAIPKIESYKVNGEIDKNLMPKTVLAKYNKIYDKYDKLISPLLETTTEIKIDKPTIATNTTAEVGRVKSLNKIDEDGVTFNIDGVKYEGPGLVVPVISMNTTMEELTPEMISNFVEEHSDKIGDSDTVKVGIYKFPNSNQVSIDLNILAPESSRDQAIEFGRLSGQESLFDMSTFKNVKTGATGENTMEFTPQQFKEIAKSLKEGKMPNVFGTQEVASKTETKKTEYKQNLVTPENAREVASKQDTLIRQKIAKSAAMIMRALPNVKIYLHNNKAEMYQALADNTGKSVDEVSSEVGNSAGSHVNGEIHINMEIAKATTMLHEAFHEAILRSGKSIKTITDFANGLKNIISDKDIKAKLDKFVSMYEESDQSEEFLSELGAIIGEAETELTTTKLHQFLNLINRIAKSLGLPVILKSTATAQEAVDFINTMAKSLRTGEGIAVSDSTNVDTNELSIKLDKTGDFDISYFEDADEFKKLVKEGTVENNYDINKISGEVVAIHQPDNMFVGALKNLDKLIFNGNGGVFYTSITGNVWASGAESSAKSLANLINKSLKESTDGVGRLALVRGTDSKMISSTEGVKASMSIIELLVDKGLINRSEFRSSLIRVGKKFNIDFSGKDSSAAIHKDIKEKFMDVKNSTFQKRGDFFDEVINDLSKTSKSANENIDGIRKALGSKRKISFSKDGIRDSIGNILTERLLKDLPTSHLYAIIEVTEPVTYRENKGHDSYPWILESKSKPKIKLLSDRNHAVKDGVFEMIDGSVVTQGKLGLAQRGMGIAKIKNQLSERLTEDKNGNYVFHHYSRENRDSIKPTSGEASLIVSKEEASAISSVGGVAQYYTMQNQAEPGVGPVLHTVLVSKEEVYYLQEDKLSLYDTAREEFQKARPGQAFSPNYQAAWIGKVANDMGYKMLVSEWRNGELRAQTTLELKPEEKNTEFKERVKDTYKVGEKAMIYGRESTITKVDGNILTYEGSGTSGTFNVESPFNARSIKKIRLQKTAQEELPLYKFGNEITTTIDQDKPISVLPLPERYMNGYEEATGKKLTQKDKQSFLYKLGRDHKYKKGGIYIDISNIENKDTINGYVASSGEINIDPKTGRASLNISENISSPEESSIGKLIKTNLFKKKAGWNWTSDSDKSRYDKVETLVSVEIGSKHVYTLGFKSTTPIQLKNYSESKSEPRLRPTTKGQLFLGNYVGNITIRGKKHPVYDNVYSYDQNDYQTLDRLNYKYLKPEGLQSFYPEQREATYKELKYNPSITLKDRLIDADQYIFDKLGIKNAEYISGGVEASVYDMGNGKVIRISKNPSNFSNNIVNKKIEGVIPVYATGKVILPKRMFGLEYYTGQVIKIESREGGLKETEPLYYSILKKGDSLNVKEDLNAILNKLINYITKILDKNIRFTDSIEDQLTLLNEQELYEFKNNLDDKQLKDLNRIIEIKNNLKKIGVNERDSHTGNYVRNSNGDLEAVDLQYVRFDEGSEFKKIEEKNVIRLQKTAQETRMDNESESVFKKSLDRGTDWPTATQNALDYIQKSKWYQDATDIDREQKIRDFKQSKNQKIKKAPSVAKVLGAPKPNMVTVNEVAAFKDQLKLEAKAAREAKADINSKRKSLGNAIKGMVKLGKLKATQAVTIIKRVSQVNLDNQVMVERLIDYASRVFERADYQERLDRAFSYRRAIRRLLKSDNQAQVIGMAKLFSKIDPSLVDDIDTYIELAENVLNAVRPSKEKGMDVALRQASNIETVAEYANEEISKQKENRKRELMAEYKYLVDSGVLTEDLSVKEMQEIISLMENPNTEFDPEADQKKLKFLQTRLASMEAVFRYMLANNINPFTGEDVVIDPKDADLIKRLLKMDLTEMSVRDAAKVVEAMDNFLMNNITSGLEAAVRSYEGAQNAKQLVAQGKKAIPLRSYFSKVIGRVFGEQMTSLPLLFEKMFPGIKNSANIMQKMGLVDVINGSNKAVRQHNDLMTEYSKQDFYKEKGFMEAKNVYERGMLSFLKRNLIGTKTEIRDEFKRRAEIIKQSIDALRENGTDKEIEMADLYQEAYDKLGISEFDLDVIEARAEKMNKDATAWMINEWGKIYSELADVSLSVYNSILGSDTNYTPDRYKSLSAEDKGLDEALLNSGSGFMMSMDYTDKNKTGVLMEATRPKVLPIGRYISLDFDVNNFNSLKGALVDINTAAAIRQVDGFTKSKAFNRLVPEAKDRKILTKRINTYIQRAKGKKTVTTDTIKDVERLANFVTALGVGKALGGLDQPIKQTIPVIINTFINSNGNMTFVNADMNEAINRSGMPIANRGLEAQTTVQSIDRLLEKKGGFGAEAIKKIEDINQFWLKTLLAKPDVWVARSSFITYYLKDMRSKGENVKDINWETHQWDKDSAQYAQLMVDRQQNISDEKLAGDFLSSDDPTKRIARKVIMPFATFIMNQKARMHNDFLALRSKDTSTEDRKSAIKSLVGLGAELAAYQLIAYGIKTLVYDNIANYLVGDDEEEEKDKSLLGLKMTTKQFNATKFPVKSIVGDILSPLPFLDDFIVMGFDKVMESYPQISEQDIKKSVEEKNSALRLQGKEEMDENTKAKFIEQLKADNVYSVAFKNDSQSGRAYGMMGIAYDTYKELIDLSSMAYTGEFEDEYQGRVTKKYLPEEDRKILQNISVPLMILYSTGIAPKDLGTVARKVTNIVKKKAVTENQHEKDKEVKKQINRDLSEWEFELVKTRKKTNGIVDEINYVESKGGLDNKQGKEYVKLMDAFPSPSDDMIRDIQKGMTADQIIKRNTE